MGNKVNHFKLVATATLGERVPRVKDAYHWATPYQMDPTVDWATWLAGTEPRAILLSVRTSGTHTGKVYPTDLTDAASVENFLGLLIDGTDYENDLNVTVTLAGAIPLRYLQSLPAKPSGVVDNDVVAKLADLKIKRIKEFIFWDNTRVH